MEPNIPEDTPAAETPGRSSSLPPVVGPSNGIDADPWFGSGSVESQTLEVRLIEFSDEGRIVPTTSDSRYLRLRRIQASEEFSVREGTASPPRLWMLVILLIVSWLLLLSAIILQLLGLGYAISRIQNVISPIAKTWCCPGFQLASNSTTATGLIFDGSCNHNYTVTLNNQGTGCIEVPGDQLSWLRMTVVIVTIELALQSVDLVLLIMFRNKVLSPLYLRPVCTMAFGAFVWTALTIIAGVQTTEYPLISGVVAIVADGIQACRLELDSAGLRGEIIAWSDGVFGALNKTYFGPFGLD